MNVCHSETSSIGCGASYGCTQRAESGAAMSHYMCDLIPRCVGFLAAMTGLHIHHIHHVHIWDCLVIFRSACWSICDTASCHRLLGFHHLPPFPEHSWARWSIFPYDWQQRSVVAALQIMDFLCFLYPLHGLRHHNSDEFTCFKRLVANLQRLVIFDAIFRAALYQNWWTFWMHRFARHFGGRSLCVRVPLRSTEGLVDWCMACWDHHLISLVWKNF